MDHVNNYHQSTFEFVRNSRYKLFVKFPHSRKGCKISVFLFVCLNMCISPVFRQFLTIACCNLLTISFGSSTGWATINSIDLQNGNSTFSTGPLTSEQSALVISVVHVGAFIGNFAVVPISQMIGVKNTIHLFGLPIIISSLLIIWAKNAYYLYASRLLSGFVGGGLVVSIPILINDVSFDRVRGALNSLYDPSYNSGIILSFVLGNYLSCLDQAKIQLILPLIATIIMFLLPESPDFWAKRNNEKRATKSHKFYKGHIKTPENVEFLEKSQNLENGKLEIVKDDDCENKRSATRLEAFRSSHAKKAFFISFTSLILSFLCGTLVILSYITEIFHKTGSSFTDKNSSILISIITLVANLVFVNIVERINRKTLYVGSSILTAMSFFLFVCYCFFWLQQPEYEWMPPLCIACIIYFSCMGLLPIPYIITIEIFPKEIRDVCLAMAVSMIWIVLFILGYVFPIILSAIGLPACMTLLGIMCLLNAIFGIFFMPETRGKSHDEIMKLLNK